MRLRFTIRDLLWLTLMVAMAVGWWLDRGSFARDRDILKSILTVTGEPEQVKFRLNQLRVQYNDSQSAGNK
jgi:hypothetical protein